MSLHPLHRERMDDAKHADRLGPMADRRGAHLARLSPVEAMVHANSPLPCSYDVSRGQPPFFNEFTYTECLGMLFVQPQSSEIGARLLAHAADAPHEFDFDVADMVAGCDKYRLADIDAAYRSVVFPPGGNIFNICMSREAMDRAMAVDPDLMIKLHPLTNTGLIEMLGMSYGYHRLIDPTASGWSVLAKADTIHVTTASEMGLHGFLLGKDVRNVTAYGFESQGTFNAIYRLLWGLGADEAKAVLMRVLNSPYSGLFHPDDPNLSEKMNLYFAKAMELRAFFKPLVREYEPREYAQLVNHQLRAKKPEPPKT